MFLDNIDMDDFAFFMTIVILSLLCLIGLFALVLKILSHFNLI